MGGLSVTLRAPWLLFELGAPHRVAGWPVVGPAWGTAGAIAWLQVRDDDLTAEIDAAEHFRRRAAEGGIAAEIGLMTSAEIADYACERAGDVTVLATAGLTNGESVIPGATAPSQPWHAGTVNIAVHCAAPLADAAMLEALSIVAEARTAAILTLGLKIDDGRPMTGTGTDCIIVASPEGAATLLHCGMHTPIGRQIGEATYAAMERALARKA